MSRIKMTIWGRRFTLETIFECYGEQQPIKSQEDAIEKFTEELPNKVLLNVKQYCLSDEKMNGEKDIINIFKYVIPNTIYIMRDTKKRKIALLCDYKFDIEHGIALIFENEKFKGIVSQSDL